MTKPEKATKWVKGPENENNGFAPDWWVCTCEDDDGNWCPRGGTGGGPIIHIVPEGQRDWSYGACLYHAPKYLGRKP